MLFLPAKVVEGLLVIGCSSLYSHIFVEGAVSAFNLTNTTIQLLYLILAGWMANSATRYVGEEYRAGFYHLCGIVRARCHRLLHYGSCDAKPGLSGRCADVLHLHGVSGA